MNEVYRIGIAIAMSSNASEVLGVIARDLSGLGKQAKTLESNLGRARNAAIGAMTAIGGTVTLRAVAMLVHHAKELNHQLALMKPAGVPDFSVAAASATAWHVARLVPGTTTAGNARSLHQLRAILGTPEGVTAALPDFAQAAVVLSSFTGRSQENAIQTLAGALALRGVTTGPEAGQVSPAQFGTELNLALKAIIASDGLADQDRLRDSRMMQHAAFYRLMMTAVMGMGGLRPGTALSAADRDLYGGAMTVRNKEEMEGLGLVRSGSLHLSRGGHRTADPHFLIGEQILSGPGGLFAWAATCSRTRSPCSARRSPASIRSRTRWRSRTGLMPRPMPPSARGS